MGEEKSFGRRALERAKARNTDYGEFLAQLKRTGDIEDLVFDLLYPLPVSQKPSHLKPFAINVMKSGIFQPQELRGPKGKSYPVADLPRLVLRLAWCLEVMSQTDEDLQRKVNRQFEALFNKQEKVSQTLKRLGGPSDTQAKRALIKWRDKALDRVSLPDEHKTARDEIAKIFLTFVPEVRENSSVAQWTVAILKLAGVNFSANTIRQRVAALRKELFPKNQSFPTPPLT